MAGPLLSFVSETVQHHEILSCCPFQNTLASWVKYSVANNSVAYKLCLLYGRLEVRRCMRKQGEEKALNFHLDEYQFSSLT